MRNNVLKTDKRYVGILRAVFNDCESYQDNLDKLSFNDKSIMAEVIKYNLCKRPDEQTEVREYKSKAIVKHGVEGTFANTFTPENPNDYQAQGYSAGYFWDIAFPDKSRKYSGKLGVGYMYYKYSHKEGREEVEVADVTHFVRLPLSVQYNFKGALITNLNPFILVGLTTLVPLNGESSEIVPLQSLGFGIYHGRMRYAFQIENQGFNLSDTKILYLSVGVRLN